MGHRMSSLAIAQLCGQAPRMDLGAGRAAAMSTAFHAMCDAKVSGETVAHRKKLDALTDEEREDIQSWNMPGPLELLGTTLHYKDAKTEFELGLDEDGAFTTKKDKAVTIGHADMGWILRVTIDGVESKVAVIGDIKRQRWTTPDGPASLQLEAYGYAYAQQHNADYFLSSIWLAEEGEWVIGELKSMYGSEAATRWSRVFSAATNDSEEFSHGPHCGSCWSRMNCPAHMVRYTDVLVVPGTLESELDETEALALLSEMRRFKDTVKASEEHLKEWVKRNGAIRDGQGKKWGPVEVKGREVVLSVAKLREKMGEEAEPLIQIGRPSSQYRWLKD